MPSCMLLTVCSGTQVRALSPTPPPLPPPSPSSSSSSSLLLLLLCLVLFLLLRLQRLRESACRIPGRLCRLNWVSNRRQRGRIIFNAVQHDHLWLVPGAPTLNPAHKRISKLQALSPNPGTATRSPIP